MIFSYNWLKELSGTKKSPDKLAELLMTHAFEVETIEKYPHGLDEIIIGRVESVKQHPDADRLRVTTVEVGKGDVRTIVCGAPNVRVGQKVAVVLPGGRLPDGTVIKEATLRGVTSHGMICSEKELRLGDAHTGILVLDEKAPVGKLFAPYAELDDFLLDVKILPDRSSDALSYQGLAREIAALEGVTPAFLSEKKVKHRSRLSSKVPKVTVKTDRCGRYLLAMFTDVPIETSPLWMKVRLLTSGLRPINSVVDVTNYLMLLTGQPMHAFDADAIAKGGLVIREGKGREQLTLLDGQTVHPRKEDIVIADGKHVLALAGIMGGKSSGITEKTKHIVVEIAHFEGKSIRRTRKYHGLITDASFRFERGFDLDRPGEAFTELLSLMEKTGWGKYVGSRDVMRRKERERTINLPIALVERVLGTTVPLFEAVQHLALLGLSVKKVTNKKELSVTIPRRRIDLANEWDLVEEIGRSRGYETVKSIAPLAPLEPAPFAPERQFERSLRRALIGEGYDEVMLYSFYGEKVAKLCGLTRAEHLTIANPLSPDQVLMRTSLLPNLLSASARNLRQFESFKLFELGQVFGEYHSQPTETSRLALLSVVPRGDDQTDFFTFKADIEALGVHFGLLFTSVAMAQTPKMYHPTRSAAVSVSGETVGHLGEIHPNILRALGIRARVFACELELAALHTVLPGTPAITPLRRFPLAYRDISLVGKKNITFAEVSALLKESGGPLLVQSELFDVYQEGEEKSYAFHLAFGHTDRTIRSEEMDEVFDGIVNMAANKLGMRLKLS